MEILGSVLPIILYLLLIVLIIILIMLSLKCLHLMNKLESVTDDIAMKVKSVNAFFKAIDKLTDSISLISDKMVISVSSFISKLFTRKRKDDK